MTSKSLTLSRLLPIARQRGNLKVPEMKSFVLPFLIQEMNKPFLPLKHITAIYSLAGIDVQLK